MAYEDAKTEWNIDDDRMKTLSAYMKRCEIAFIEWNLEDINRYLHAIKRVVLGAYGKKKDKKLMKKFESLEDLKRKMDSSDNAKEYERKAIKFYNLADKIYTMFNKLNIGAGMYFRRGKDPSRAAFDIG